MVSSTVAHAAAGGGPALAGQHRAEGVDHAGRAPWCRRCRCRSSADRAARSSRVGCRGGRSRAWSRDYCSGAILRPCAHSGGRPSSSSRSLATVLVASPGLASDGTREGAAPAERARLQRRPGRRPHRARWTRTALVRFQAANRLAQSGSLTPATRTRLYAAAPVRCDRRPVAGARGTGRRIVISQRPELRVAGAAPTAGSWPRAASSTTRATCGPGPTPPAPKCGRAAQIRDNTDASGRLRLHNFTRFAPCGIGFHQIPQYRSTGAQIHPDFLLGTEPARSRTAASGSAGRCPSGSGTSRRRHEGRRASADPDARRSLRDVVERVRVRARCARPGPGR